MSSTWIRALPALALLTTGLGCDADPSGTDGGAVDANTPQDAATRDAGGRDAASPSDAAGQDAGSALDAGPPAGSAGCGRASPPTGPLTLTLAGDTLEYIVSLPSDYDPARPYPVVFGLHGANRTHTNCQMGDCAGFQSSLEDEAILAYPRSVAAGWQDSADIRARNFALFTQLLDTLEAGYCVDADRIVVAGTSSGATFSNDLGCRLGDRLRAVVPVAGGVPRREGCVGHPIAVVIHGVDDPHVLFEYGEDAREAYRVANGCDAETDPAIADLHGRVVANRESHECADFRGCNPGLAVRWCEHSEGGYDDSTHGWPLFGGQAIHELLGEL